MNHSEIYKKYLARIRERIISRYYATGAKATLEFQKELEDIITDSGFKLLGAEHSQWIEKGRGPGHFPSPKNLEEWIEKKEGLPKKWKEKKVETAKWLSVNIGLKGTKLFRDNETRDIFSGVIQEFMENDFWELLKELGNAYAERIRSDLVELIKVK
jgi:hypothetical protein